jgi:peptide/nickel transport system substrate-binding protein
MSPLRPTRCRTAASLAVLAAVTLLAAGAGNAARNADTTLVVDSAFVLNSLDPAIDTNTQAMMMYKATYDTLLGYKGSSSKVLVPDLATSYTASSSAKRYVFHLRRNAKFSDGTPVTAADVVFSFNRYKYLSLKYSPFFQNLTTAAQGKYTVVVTSSVPDASVPALVAVPGTSIVNSKVVAAQGGLATPDAAQNDKATSYLNQHSAGSGPYILSSAELTSQVVLTANPKFWGTKPKYSRIVIKNVQGSQQRLDVISGDAQIATDLSGPLLDGLPRSVAVRGSTPNAIWLAELNVDSTSSPVTANPKIREAVRYGIDTVGLRKIAGYPAIPAPSLVPLNMPGALKAKQVLKQNVARAKAAVAASGISNPTIKLTYPGGLIFNGKSFDALAQKIQSDLAKVGITVTLDPTPYSAYSKRLYIGDFQMDFRPQVPKVLDPSGFMAFAPGGQMAVYSHYTANHAPKNVVSLANKLQVASGAKRIALMTQFQNALDASNPPYVYLFDSANVIVYSKTVKGVQVSPGQYLIDLASLSPA